MVGLRPWLQHVDLSSTGSTWRTRRGEDWTCGPAVRPGLDVWTREPNGHLDQATEIRQQGKKPCNSLVISISSKLPPNEHPSTSTKLPVGVHSVELLIDLEESPITNLTYQVRTLDFSKRHFSSGPGVCGPFERPFSPRLPWSRPVNQPPERRTSTDEFGTSRGFSSDESAV